MITPNFLSRLQALQKNHIEFIVVGGVGEVLQGAPITTFDLDVVHSRDPGNLHRLLTALNFLDANYRTPGAKRRKPEYSHLQSTGHQFLMTRAGPLGLLGTIGHGHSYDDLIGQTIDIEIGEGLQVHVLKLDAIIGIKEETAGEKDKLALLILRRTLQEAKAR